jgi:hypothetical protein
LDVHVVDFHGRVFSCMRHVLDGSNQKPALDSYSLLAGRRRLKLSGFPTLDDFQTDRRGKEAGKAAAAAAAAAAAPRLKKHPGSNAASAAALAAAEDDGEAAAAWLRAPLPALVIPKKVPKKAAPSGGDGTPGGSASGGSTTLRGTRMKIRGFDPTKAARKVCMLIFTFIFPIDFFADFFLMVQALVAQYSSYRK